MNLVVKPPLPEGSPRPPAPQGSGLDEITLLRLCLLDAAADIGHWVQFAKRQQRELPNVDYLPCGPTDNGIAVSERVIARIHDVLTQTKAT